MYKKAARAVADLGYTNVRVFPVGIPGWVKAGFPLERGNAMRPLEVATLSVEDLAGIQDRVTILDIRSPSLYENGFLPGSVRIPLGELSRRYAEIPTGKPIVVVDHAGKQVKMAALFLAHKGLEVSRVEGGIMSWMMKGYAVSRN